MLSLALLLEGLKMRSILPDKRFQSLVNRIDAESMPVSFYTQEPSITKDDSAPIRVQPSSKWDSVPSANSIFYAVIISYVLLCTLSLTMPIWGIGLFSNIVEQLPQKDVLGALPPIAEDTQPCSVCEGLRLPVSHLDDPIHVSPAPEPPELLKLARE